MKRENNRLLIRAIKKPLLGLVTSFLVVLSMLPAISYAEKVDERPSPLAMAADTILVRPVMLATTVGGAFIYVVTLPISLLGGNSEEVGEKMVIVPFKSTFLRCLGCTKRHMEDRDQYY